MCLRAVKEMKSIDVTDCQHNISLAMFLEGNLITEATV